MRLSRIALPLFLLLLCPAFARAQARIDAFFGMGTAHDGATVSSVLGAPVQTPSMGGVFGVFGGDFMLKPSLGVGAQISLRFAQGDYATGIGYRPVFYDFNGIWTPSFGTKRIMPEIQAGFGGASMRFYGGAQYCDPYTGTCSNFLGSNNHFQLHTALGLRIYFKEHAFIRPQFDYHWVHGLNQEFNSDSVTAYTLALGYSF